MKHENDVVLLGRIVSPFGIRGELKVLSYAADRKRFGELERIWVSRDEAFHEVERVRYGKGDAVFLKLSGIDDRNAAELFRNADVGMDQAELPPPEDGAVYIRDILGSEVFDEEGVRVGTLTDVLTDRPQPLLVIRDEAGKEVLVPAVPAFLKEKDVEARRIVIARIEGLF